MQVFPKQYKCSTFCRFVKRFSFAIDARVNYVYSKCLQKFLNSIHCTVLMDVSCHHLDIIDILYYFNDKAITNIITPLIHNQLEIRKKKYFKNVNIY